MLLCRLLAMGRALLSQLCNPLMSSVFELTLAVLLPLYYITGLHSKECCKFQLCLIVEIASLVYKAWICSSWWWECVSQWSRCQTRRGAVRAMLLRMPSVTWFVLTERPDPESCIGCHRATRAPELSSLCARLRSTLGLSALSFMHVALMWAGACGVKSSLAFLFLMPQYGLSCWWAACWLALWDALKCCLHAASAFVP